MKKIGIITIVKVNNYGAELQALALQKKLCLMGYDAEIINYLFYKHKKHKKEKCSMPFYPYPLKNRIKEWFLPIYESIKSIPYKKANEKRKEGFVSFHKRNTRFSKKCFFSYSELYNDPPIYDVYCVGSDQVWNPRCYTNLNPYFVSFAPEGKKKISYASSFGVKELPESAKKQYSKLLQGLDSISVREDAGIEIVKDISGRNATKVVDPTLLLTKTEWQTVAKYDKVPNRKYILLYVLKDSEYIKQTALTLRDKTGLQIVRICKGAFKQDKPSDNIIDIIDAAPDDFLGLIEKAEIVLTNSFHGTVFSILFERDFYTILKRNVENNSRQTSLLNTLHIDRIRYEDTEFISGQAIDYRKCKTAINSLKASSEQYLINAIEN